MLLNRCSGLWRKIYRGFNGFSDALCLSISHRQSVVVFRKAIYIWLLYDICMIAPLGSTLFGSNAYVFPVEYEHNSVSDLFFALSYRPASEYWRLFLVAYAVLIIGGILGVYPRLVSVGLYYAVKNVQNAAWPVTNGAHCVIELMLFYNMFMSVRSGDASTSLSGQCVVAMTNAAHWLARFQIAVMYAVSGLSKVKGVLWQKGVAMYYIIQVEEYSNPDLAFLSKYDIFVVASTYSSILFMLSFPFLIWYDPWRRLLLLFGLMSHAFIAIGLGVVDFSLAVLCCYPLFLSEREASAVVRCFSNNRRWGLKWTPSARPKTGDS